MTEVIKTILKFAFIKLKLHKLYASCFEENVASRKVLEKNGFMVEGVLKEQRFRFGRWHNEWKFGLLKSDWENKIRNKV